MNNEPWLIPMSVDKASDLGRYRRGQGYQVLIGACARASPRHPKEKGPRLASRPSNEQGFVRLLVLASVPIPSIGARQRRSRLEMIPR